MSSRGRRLYDWWSRHPVALRALYGLVFLGREETLRRASVEALSLSSGETVIELGCGRGNSFGRLRDTVGSSGRVVGVDFSPGMVRAARERVTREGWENVHVVRGDAGRLPVAPESADAVYAAMSLTAMPDATQVAREAEGVLRSGGRMAVLDARPFQHGPFRVLNPLVVPLSEFATDWHPETDPVDAMRAAFPDVASDETTGGAVVVVVGRTE